MGRVTAAKLGTELHDESPRRQGRLVRRLTSDHVAEHLRGMFFSGALRPGERLRQDEIAAQLGVSRLPVREAVQVMERDGLVVVEPHLGAFVAPFDAQVIHDHFEIVGLVQGVAAGRLAERGDPELLEPLEAIARQIRTAKEPDRVHELTLEFYRLINREGASSRQRSVLRALSRMLPSGFFLDIDGATESERNGAQRIWKAITSGDSDAVLRTCLTVQLERAELINEALRARGVFEPA
jgi:DNA-binding GntR family transcriptional regulator